MQSVRRADAGLAPLRERRGELSRRQALRLLSAVTLLGAFLRILTLNSRSFWLDEATSVRQASWDLPVIFDRMSANVHPPLFHILLHYWIRVFGRTEIAVRSYPLLFGILAIPLAYWAATAIYDRRVGLLSAAVVALSPYFIWYSQEARMYTLMLVFAFLSLGSLFKAMQTQEPRWWWLYALSTAAGMFTQFFFAFLILTQGLYVLVFLVIRRERELSARGARAASWTRPWRVFRDCPEATTWLLCMIVVVLPLAWWVPQVLGHREVAATFAPLFHGSKGFQPANFYQTLNYGNSGPQLGWHFNEIMLAASQAAFGMHSDAVSRSISAMWPLAITLAFLVSGYVRRVSARTWYVIFTGVFGFSIIAIIGQWQPVYEVRYYMAVSAPMVVLFARFLAELRRPYVQIVCGVLVAAALISYVDQSYNPDSLVKWDNREAISTIYSQYQPGDVILLIPYYASSIFEYYLPPDAYFAVRQIPQFTPSGEPRNDPELMSQDLARQVGPSRRVWVVSSFVETPRVQKDRVHVVDWLEQQGYTRTSDQQLHRIRVSLYEGAPRTGFFINQGGGQ